jgi:hypothetical protein
LSTFGVNSTDVAFLPLRFFAANLATDIASIIYFGWTGHIICTYAGPMALCSVLGAAIGARVAIAKGSRFVRIFFLVVVAGFDREAGANDHRAIPIAAIRQPRAPAG